MKSPDGRFEVFYSSIGSDHFMSSSQQLGLRDVKTKTEIWTYSWDYWVSDSENDEETERECKFSEDGKEFIVTRPSGKVVARYKLPP